MLGMKIQLELLFLEGFLKFSIESCSECYAPVKLRRKDLDLGSPCCLGIVHCQISVAK